MRKDHPCTNARSPTADVPYGRRWGSASATRHSAGEGRGTQPSVTSERNATQITSRSQSENPL